MFKTVLFDMDGTLVPMDQNKFTREYFTALGAHSAKYGYPPEKTVAAVERGAYAMVKNDGSKTNYDVFWSVFFGAFPDRPRSDERIFDEFYKRDFDKLKHVASRNDSICATVSNFDCNGINMVLASNPVFPQIAQLRRLDWAGIDPTAFMYITSYENSHYCKPNPKYYTEIAEKLDLDPKECLMIGNDAIEDGAARAAGFEVFLLTNCLLNGDRVDLDKFPHGGNVELDIFLMEHGM